MRIEWLLDTYTKLTTSKGFKLVILDEADMMTQAAQGALRRGTLSLHYLNLTSTHMALTRLPAPAYHWLRYRPLAFLTLAYSPPSSLPSNHINHAFLQSSSTVIETHTKNVRFCILCNYVNKITPAIQSRCTRFRFSPLPEEEVQKKVDQVVEKEGCTLTPDGKQALLKLSRGDMRRALNVLQVSTGSYR